MTPTKIISKVFGKLKNIPFLPIILDEQMKIFTLFLRPNVFAKMIELTQWLKEMEGVRTRYHRYGGMEFTLNGKEICHIHGDGLVDVKLNAQLKQELIGQEGVENHHALPDSHMVSYQITKTAELSVLKSVVLASYLLLKK